MIGRGRRAMAPLMKRRAKAGRINSSAPGNGAVWATDLGSSS